jgi:hypothetical protein
MARIRKPPFGIEPNPSGSTGSVPVGSTEQSPSDANGVDRGTTANDHGADSPSNGIGDSDSGDLGIDPASIRSGTGGGDGSGSDGGNGRKRRKYTRRVKQPTGAEAAQAKSSLALYISKAHLTAAKVFKIPELELAEKECEELAAATMQVAAYYKIPVIAGEVMAWLNLLAVAGSIYAPRIAAHTINLKKKTVDAKQPHIVKPISITEASDVGA